MRLAKKCFLFILFLGVATAVHAQEEAGTGRYLTGQQIERVRAFKELLYGVDKESLQKTLRELERTKNPQFNIEMKEAMAHAYVDIVSEENVEGQKKKEWLYSMVCLNMAYLQFGGSQGKYGSTTELNRLIRQKLIHYLPTNALKQPGFVYSLE